DADDLVRLLAQPVHARVHRGAAPEGRLHQGGPRLVQEDRQPVPRDRGARQPRAGEPLRGGGQIARVLFYRDFKRFTGGDLKVWDYFNHVRSSPNHTAQVRFSADSVWDETNPWNTALECVVADDEDVDFDVL